MADGQRTAIRNGCDKDGQVLIDRRDLAGFLEEGGVSEKEIEQLLDAFYKTGKTSLQDCIEWLRQQKISRPNDSGPLRTAGSHDPKPKQPTLGERSQTRRSCSISSEVPKSQKQCARDEYIKLAPEALDMFRMSRAPYEGAQDVAPYPARTVIDDHLVSWYVPFLLRGEKADYRPADWDQPKLFKHVDPPDPRAVRLEHWEARERRSFRDTLVFDARGRPLNPIGRTGLAGRGCLSFWGPNFCSDLVVTRMSLKVSGQIQALCEKRGNSLWKVPGAMVDDEDFIDHSKRLIDPILPYLSDYGNKAWQDSLRKTEKWHQIYCGYVDDNRNTDNAWVESTFYHYHLEHLDHASRLASRLTKNTESSKKFYWVTVRTDNHKYMTSKFVGSHAEILLRAANIKLPPLIAKPLVESKLVRVSHEPNETTFDAKGSGVAFFSGLVDEHDCVRLLESLWLNAGKPTVSTDDEDLFESEDKMDQFFADRRNWSRYNLQRFYKHYEPEGIAALAKLQTHTAIGYKQVLKTPVRAIAMKSSSKNLLPFAEHLYPLDKSTLVSDRCHPTGFMLSRHAFECGSERLKRSQLEGLWARMTSTQNGNVKQSTDMYLQGSPVSSLSMARRGRVLADIPEEARFMCWLYPKDHVTATAVIKEEVDRPPRDESLYLDPFYIFLTVGGFVLFDFKYDIIDVLTLDFSGQCHAETEDDVEDDEDEEYNYGQGMRKSNRKFFYGHPSGLPLTAIRHLNDLGRWCDVSITYMKDKLNFTKFCYIIPSEFLGDHVFPQEGGFAYLHADPKRSLFFPLVFPEDDEPLEVEPVKPILYEAPVHIPGISDYYSEKRNRLASAGSSLDGLTLTKSKTSDKFIDESTANMSGSSGLTLAKAKDSAHGIAYILGYDTEHALFQHSINLASKYDSKSIADLFEKRDGLGKKIADMLSLKKIADTFEKQDGLEKMRASAAAQALIPLAVEICMHVASLPELQEEHISNLIYVLLEKASEKEETGNDGRKVVVRDMGHQDLTLNGFHQKKESTECGLELPEVFGLRLYTTSSFRLINDPLRQNAMKKNTREKHPLAITTYYITTGLKKLRGLNFKQGSIKDQSLSYLWRGMKDRSISDDFMISGGAELACMSTTENLEVVTSYAASKSPLLFRIKIDSPMDRGATIKWLSAYPHEDEILYPPMTCLQPIYKQSIMNSSGIVVSMKVSFPS